MRVHDALTGVLGSRSKVALLRTMFVLPDRQWTGRELARAARVSTAHAARELAELAESSLVDRDVAGRSYLWRLNRSHVLEPTLSALFHHEAGLPQKLLQEVAASLPKSRIERALVFGSVTSGDERDDSDLDLFIQIRSAEDREAAEAAVDAVRQRIWATFGIPVSSLIYTREDLARPRSRSLVERILRSGVDPFLAG